MLQQALVALIDHLEDASWLGETLSALGAKHLEYGVTDEMYGWVGECLLATLTEVAGKDWSPALAVA
jgi:hemoglobin-like flavoprotein